MKECLSWETEPALVEDVVDACRRHPLVLICGAEPEVVNFWAPPQSDTPKVSERLIRALGARMSFEELRSLPPVVYVGMRREVSKSGTVSLFPSDLYHVACALLVPIRVYDTRRSAKGRVLAGSGFTWTWSAGRVAPSRRS